MIGVDDRTEEEDQERREGCSVGPAGLSNP